MYDTSLLTISIRNQCYLQNQRIQNLLLLNTHALPKYIKAPHFEKCIVSTSELCNYQNEFA